MPSTVVMTDEDDDLLEGEHRSSRLELEITETAVLEVTPQILAMLGALGERGVRIVLDDFGTGHSSLGHLREFRLDGLKLSSDLIYGLEHDRKTAAIIAAVAFLAGSGPFGVLPAFLSHIAVLVDDMVLMDHGPGQPPCASGSGVRRPGRMIGGGSQCRAGRQGRAWGRIPSSARQSRQLGAAWNNPAPASLA